VEKSQPSKHNPPPLIQSNPSLPPPRTPVKVPIMDDWCTPMEAPPRSTVSPIVHNNSNHSPIQSSKDVPEVIERPSIVPSHHKEYPKRDRRQSDSKSESNRSNHRKWQGANTEQQQSGLSTSQKPSKNTFELPPGCTMEQKSILNINVDVCIYQGVTQFYSNHLLNAYLSSLRNAY